MHEPTPCLVGTHLLLRVDAGPASRTNPSGHRPLLQMQDAAAWPRALDVSHVILYLTVKHGAIPESDKLQPWKNRRRYARSAASAALL